MTPEIILGSSLLVPVILTYVFKVNAAILFMSVCVGEVLALLVAKNVTSYLIPLSPTGNISYLSMRLFLLLAPPVLTLLIMFHSIKGKSKLLLNIVPSIATGLLLALIVVPQLTPGLKGSIEHSSLWHNFDRYQTLIVIFGALCAIVFLLLSRGTPPKHSKHSKSH